MQEVFALLDDCHASAAQPSSRLYTGYAREHCCTDAATLDAMWMQVEADQRAGLHAVLLADYEWGAKLMRAGHARLASDDRSALRVLMFRALQRLSTAEVADWLARRAEHEHAALSGPQASGVMNLVPSVDRRAFTQAIGQIHEAIAAGETYQVNYTYRLHGQAYGTPLALYRQLRARQPVAYGALIALPAADHGGVHHVLSCSPELFLRGEAGLLTARPMKGTAARSLTAEGDSETARLLGLDIKNRAENLMIVDLLRNDLGRIAQTGSVKVPELFVVEPYSTVFQMTSTVQARLRPGLGFPDLLRAVFPCGSITGAPKHHTMELIAGLESTPRGLYCGAIGWLDAPAEGQRIGDFCLSVAIRTLTLGDETNGLRPATLGIGAGIVADSRAEDEFDECRLKARFLTRLDPGFELFETMRAEPRASRLPLTEAIPLLDRHLVRLARSACALGFRFQRERIVEALEQLCADGPLPGDAPSRVRLALSHDARVRLTHARLTDLPATPDGIVTLLIAPQRLPDHSPLAAHKTTLRQHYDDGVRAAEQAGAFDSLFFSADGRLVEGGRSSVFVRLDGVWYTPPTSDGALPGVMRSVLLEDPAWAARERSLRLDDLLHASEIRVCNALRGVLAARLATQAATQPPAAPPSATPPIAADLASTRATAFPTS